MTEIRRRSPHGVKNRYGNLRIKPQKGYQQISETAKQVIEYARDTIPDDLAKSGEF